MEQGRKGDSFIITSSFFASPEVLRFISFLRERLSEEQQYEIAVALGACLECGGRLIHVDGEIVCGQCGIVWRENDEDLERNRIPFPEFEEAIGNGHYEMHWNPECSLAFEKGLGTHLDDRALAEILTRSELGETKTITVTRILAAKAKANNHDPPQLRRLLARISVLLDKNGLRENHVIADYAGRIMRKIYLIAKAAGVRLPVTMADAIVAYTFYKFNIKNYRHLKPKIRDLAFIKWYIQTTAELHRTYKLSKKLLL